MKFSFRFVATFCFLGMQAALSQAADVQVIRIVADDESRFVRDTARSLADLLKHMEPAVEVNIVASLGANEINSGKQFLVVIGERAIKKTETNAPLLSPVIVIASQRTPFDLGGKKSPVVSVIQYEQPITRLLNLATLVDAKKWQTGNSAVGIIVTPELQKYLTTAETAANERKQRLRVEVVDNEIAVGRVVGKLVDEASIFIAIPDPIVHTANTVQPILLLTYRVGIPVIGYSAAYLNAGATVALYSTPEQLARQAAETIVAYRAGKPIPAKQVPRYFTVNVNSTVARSLGIEIATTAALEDSLRSMKE